jgi:hypothetical protein
MNPDQSGIKPFGPFTVLAGEDLTGKRSFLTVLTHDTGIPEVKLPAAITDDAFYLLNEAGADGDLVDVEPLQNGQQVRVWLKGTGNPGDNLCLAAIAGADAGKVRKVPATTGTYRPLFKLEEAGVDGALVKARFFHGLPSVTVA